MFVVLMTHKIALSNMVVHEIHSMIWMNNVADLVTIMIEPMTK